jgi:hypothetical protein
MDWTLVSKGPLLYFDDTVGYFCKTFWKIGLPKVFDSEVNDFNIDHGQNCFELADGLDISFQRTAFIFW